MQFLKIYLKTKFYLRPSSIFTILVFSFFTISAVAQVNTVEFGKNRVQFKKFKWAYYQTENFNTYYSQNGDPLAKYVAQVAEKELPELESFTEYGLQRRANIIVYNHFNELQQSNIGSTSDWQNAGGSTKLVNNKMVVYYNGDHNNLRRQIREGLTKILVDNILFGDDLGEFATNQALLDLPKWLTDGYVSYAGENWNTELDDQLKSAMLSGSYKNFYQFAFDKPLLAGHSFWYYVAETYKKENVTYFLYLARVYRNLNGASQRIAKKKFRELLREFMDFQEQKYYKDIRSRRNAPKGTTSVVEEVSNYRDYFRFTPNPAPRTQSYAVVEFKRGIERVVLYDNNFERKVLLKSGVRNHDNTPNPNYPLLAWDPKGTRLAVVYWEEGKIKYFIYDILTRYKTIKQDLPEFDQIQDFKFMLDANTLLFSAVKKGQSDIFVYKIDSQTTQQITNDIYDDLDASFVAFPNKSGIIYASNRPSVTAATGDTVLPSNFRYNVFLIDNWNRSEFKQISQLTNLKFGNVRYPAQYNNTHFTFVSDENGVGNRYAGFFNTRRAGVDTVYKVGDDLLRNPEPRDLDSLLKAYNKSEPDSIFSISITNDSAYVFALTNYQSSLIETKVAGTVGQVSEVRREGDLKFLYKLKVDENVLRRRNVNPRPTEFRRKTTEAARIAGGEALRFKPAAGGIDTTKKNEIFESEFGAEKVDSASLGRVLQGIDRDRELSILEKSKRYDYKLKFGVDQVTSSLFNNDVLITRYQPYTGSLPVTLNNGAFNGLLSVSIFDMLEDFRFTGMLRAPLINTAGQGIPINVGQENVFNRGQQSLMNSGSEYMARFDYLKHRIDYSALYYRKTDVGTTGPGYNAKLFTNLYQGILKYPFDRVKSVRLSLGVRTDQVVTKWSPDSPLDVPDVKQTFGLMHLEYVYDNSVVKATNILNGLRYKFFIDYNSQISKLGTEDGRNSFNFGFDGRYYYPIFRNLIWAGRAAGDFSWGNQKIIYYLGGVDGGLFPKYSQQPRPQDPDYAFQSLAVNMRGFTQNVANGNNALILNSEFRLPVFSTLFNKPINNAFLRNFQVIQFFDLGSAWNGAYNKIERPQVIYPGNEVSVKLKAGGIGPFVGGYGFGVRSTLLGYFLRLDTGWEMNGFFRGKPLLHFAMGVDF
ncbi:MAG TPA: hypothetical protein VEZ17_10310 [Chitinophagaceae bacterium]|nr:hypothetical protein [Chitinophagaceae bacterium]